jgi:dynein light chain roadblock-type
LFTFLDVSRIQCFHGDVMNVEQCFSDKFSHILLLGVAVKSTLDNTSTVQYAGLMGQLADKARSVVRDLDPSNDLTFLRIRSKKHEIMIAPDKDFIMIVIQNPTD